VRTATFKFFYYFLVYNFNVCFSNPPLFDVADEGIIHPTLPWSAAVNKRTQICVGQAASADEV
jgi:hypothetical protein